MIYEILDDAGNITNIISASEEFVEQHYLNHYRLVGPDPASPPSEPVKTDEEKLADAISAAVAKLIADGVLKQA